VIGSRTSENTYGVTSGHRLDEALRKRGWKTRVIHAREGAEIGGYLCTDEKPDLVVPVGFGAPCEDGHVFALCRMFGIPCAGPTPGAGSLMQDKAALGHVVDSIFPPGSRVRSPRGCVLSRRLSAQELERHVNRIAPRLLVKPNFAGSSERLSVVDTHAEAIAAATGMLEHEGKVVVQHLEEPIANEISCTVIDRADGPQFLPIVELRRDDVAVMGPKEKFGEEGRDRHIIPARLARKLATRIKEVVLRIHAEVGCIGLTRTDMLVLPDSEVVVLEQNGIPGLLESSIACDAALAGGISFEELCVLYAQSAYLRRDEPAVWGEHLDA
jgi:D-alanine-D-alanine ligase